MFHLFITPVWLLFLSVGVGALYLSVLILGKQKLLSSFFKSLVPGLVFSKAVAKPHFFNDIVDIPRDEVFGEPEIILDEQDYEDDLLEMVMDADSVLLKEAEAVVDKIEETIQHIASNPSNPEEVHGKIKSILSGYSIFFNTEYFEAINNFIRITVLRDCNINWTEQELIGLWK